MRVATTLRGDEAVVRVRRGELRRADAEAGPQLHALQDEVHAEPLLALHPVQGRPDVVLFPDALLGPFDRDVMRSKQWYTNTTRLPNSLAKVSIGRLPVSSSQQRDHRSDGRWRPNLLITCIRLTPERLEHPRLTRALSLKSRARPFHVPPTLCGISR